jgi:anti-anti-sigma factor
MVSMHVPFDEPLLYGLAGFRRIVVSSLNARAACMDISIERREKARDVSGDAVVELAVRGRIDAESGAELEHAVAEELRNGHHAIRLDCTDVSFLSSAGIRVLFNVHRAAKAAGARCLIGAASEPVARVLELTRLAPMLREPQLEETQLQETQLQETQLQETQLQETQLQDSQRTGGRGPIPPDHTPPAAARNDTTDCREGRILFIGLESPGSGGLQGDVVGSSDNTLLGRLAETPPRAVPRHAFGLGLAGLADDRPLAAIAGEMLAACGAVFHRGPQPFTAVDYSLGEGGHVPDVHLASGLIWEGLPRGRAGFEPADEEPAVRFDELAAALLERTHAECLALVVIAEVHGIVGVELIRPLAEATAEDHPRSRDPAVASRWLSFSREPVHARHTALIVGVVTRGNPASPLAEFVRPLGTGGPSGHAHAAIFPLRPLKRGAVDLAATVADLAASEPLAVMHLLGDPQPVLGSGQSELVRGCCWFAPLSVAVRQRSAGGGS